MGPLKDTPGIAFAELLERAEEGLWCLDIAIDDFVVLDGQYHFEADIAEIDYLVACSRGADAPQTADIRSLG